MKFIDHHTLKFTTLSPIHIGCDESYEPTNYVIDDDALYEFDPHVAGQALPPKERQNLLTIASAKPNQDMLKRIQSFFYQNREIFIANAVKAVPVESGVVALYEDRVGKTAQHEAGGKEVINKLVIEKASYTPASRKLYLPGSSIKGAIRTAMLDGINDGRKPAQAEKNRELQERLFQYSMRGQLHKDPMRLVAISDAHPIVSDKLPASEIRFAVNRKKHPVQIDGKLLRSQAEQRGLYQLLECIPAFCQESLVATIRFQHVPPDGHDDKFPAKDLRWNLRELAHACNGFYRPLLEAEMEILHKQGYLDRAWQERIHSLLENIGATKDPKRFLLRLGRHSGAEAMTLNGVRSIKIMQGRGENPKYEKESKTVWLAAPNERAKTGLVPFGWILVEIDSAAGDSEPNTLPHPDIDRLAIWQRKTTARITQLRERHEKRMAEQRAAEERDRLEQQEEMEQQQALEEKLQSMSPLARELETQIEREKWESDKDAFWKPEGIETWLAKLKEDPDPTAIERLRGLFEKHFPGALKNPDKTEGKKNKPAFKDRVRQVAKALNGLN